MSVLRYVLRCTFFVKLNQSFISVNGLCYIFLVVSKQLSLALGKQTVSHCEYIIGWFGKSRTALLAVRLLLGLQSASCNLKVNDTAIFIKS